jgi:hypothetical protein
MNGCWSGKLAERTRRCAVAARSVATTPGYRRRGVGESGIMPWAEKTLWTEPGEPGPAEEVVLVIGS